MRNNACPHIFFFSILNSNEKKEKSRKSISYQNKTGVKKKLKKEEIKTLRKACTGAVNIETHIIESVIRFIKIESVVILKYEDNEERDNVEQ
jgi:hypothetical protein